MHGQRIGFFSNIMKLWYWWILKYTKTWDSCLEGECIEPNFMKLKKLNIYFQPQSNFKTGKRTNKIIQIGKSDSNNLKRYS